MCIDITDQLGNKGANPSRETGHPDPSSYVPLYLLDPGAVVFHKVVERRIEQLKLRRGITPRAGSSNSSMEDEPVQRGQSIGRRSAATRFSTDQTVEEPTIVKSCRTAAADTHGFPPVSPRSGGLSPEAGQSHILPFTLQSPTSSHTIPFRCRKCYPPANTILFAVAAAKGVLHQEEEAANQEEIFGGWPHWVLRRHGNHRRHPHDFRNVDRKLKSEFHQPGGAGLDQHAHHMLVFSSLSPSVLSSPSCTVTTPLPYQRHAEF